jgi:hypothetical protein
LILRAEVILQDVDKYDVSISSPLFAQAQPALARLARGHMYDLVKQMKKFLEEERDHDK